MRVTVSAAFASAFPGAHVGTLLIDGVAGAEPAAALDRALVDVENRLRHSFEGADRAALLANPTIAPYHKHYRAFGQTFHVLRQLESVLKGRAVASPGGPLVSAMFAAELGNLLLTAGHDAAAVSGDLMIDCSRAGDRFVGIRGQEILVRPGDMVMRDAEGIISAVLYGPDERTRLQPSTQSALFVTYAPQGIAADGVRSHLHQIAEYVHLVAPGATVAALDIH
jgi:DNA/RNA-binding domain of Phe-tRNA-synthetase-like protein